ncbi:MAG: sugar ABC transporter ATP-binding protein [Planctomycetes bacterium]|nr:sugar ABC transporter ATP-binding protein [Planctomycetota bacterium]
MSNTSNEPRLRVERVCKRFGATVALDDVHLELAAGQVLAIVGENGAGKSTLMKILSGALPPDAGRMQLDGESYAPRDPAEGRRAGVAMIYQELSLAPHLSVAENITLGSEPRMGPLLRRGEQRRRAVAALRRLGSDFIDPATPVGKLPPAQRQLVEIARSIIAGCRVLVLDEPTSSLGQADVARLFELIRSLRASGVSVLYISHFLEEVREIADRYVVLRDGRNAGAGDARTATAEKIVALMVGREIRDLYPRSPRVPGDVVLAVDSIVGRRSPQFASLELRRGEVFGVAGIVGAGRTELLRTIFGLDPIRSGQVRVAGFVGPASPARRWAQGVGLVSEDRKAEGLAAGLSIADNITLAGRARLGPLGLVTQRGQDRACAPWIERLPIRCRSARQRVVDLSGGNQQKVAIARLLHADAAVLLLDEPTRGIDVGSKAEIYRLIDQLAIGDPTTGRAPRAVLMVSSYLPGLLGICDRIAVMCRGRLGPARPAAECSEHSLVLEATGTT